MAYPFFVRKLLVRTGIARYLSSVRRLTGGAGPFLHYYNDEILLAPVHVLRQMSALLEPQGPGAIDLGCGAPRFDLIPSAGTKLPADRRGWPDVTGLADLREAIAQRLRLERQLAIQPDGEVLVTHGGAGALHCTLDTFINRGDRVVLLDPAAPLYALALEQRRARVRWLPTSVEQGRLRFRLDLLARSLRGAKLLILNSPANPTGGIVADEDLEQIAWWAQRRDVLILNDEVFAPYTYDRTPASIGQFPLARRRTLTLGSTSQQFGLSALRVGWLAGHRHLVGPCVLSSAANAPFVPTLCQQIAISALRQDTESFVPIRAEFESRRRYAFERVQAMGLDPIWPGGGYFLWVNVSATGVNGGDFAQRLLRAKNVLVNPGHLFGPSGKNFVRLSFATEDGRLREGLSRLADFVRPAAARQAA